MKFETADQILSSPGQPVEWIAAPWAAQGAITEVVGHPKAAGKTTFALALGKAVLEGADFLGEPTVQSPVVFLTEQSKSTFRIMLTRAGIVGDIARNLHVLVWKETLGVKWEKVVDAAINKAEQVQAKLLVVDTIAQFAGLTGDRENNSGDALEAMRPLQVARDSDLAVLMLRHERKQGGQVGQSGRGSSAFAGAVDVILTLRRPSGQQPETVRVINSVSRFDETPVKLNIEWQPDGSFRALGIGSAPTADKALESVRAFLPEAVKDAADIKQIMSGTNVSRATGQRALDQLKELGILGEVGSGVKGDPYRYYKMVSAQTQSPSGLQ